MDARTFEQRLAAMHDHEAKLAATLGHAQTARRLAEKRADAAEGHVGTLKGIVASQRATVTEPLTYRRGGEHSFFYDVIRAKRNFPAARERIERHRAEMDVELPRRAQVRARAAATAYESAFYSTPADRRAMDALAGGFSPFERRAISTTPSQGGYLAPPVYLVDQYVPFARAAAAFSSDWHPMILPPATSEVNVPRLTLGTGTGPQNDLTPVVTRDISDSLASAQVRQVAGLADVSYQWLEQGGGSAGHGVDELVFADLTADIAQNIDGQALLGSNTSGQILGVWPAGAIAAANGIVQASTDSNVDQTWMSGLHVNAAQLVSLCRRIRARSDGWAWYWNPWCWSLYTAQLDGNGRPLVNDQCVDLPEGVAGYYQNIPVKLDANIPTTFGGATSAPYIGPLTNGQYAAYPGAGSGNSFTPLLLARPADLFMFAGEIRLRLLEEVLSGAGMARFQADQYLAAMPNRYVAAAAVGSTVSAGGDVAHGTLTWQESNSILILAGSGY
jgi:HK97 family phage major capsid protein